MMNRMLTLLIACCFAFPGSAQETQQEQPTPIAKLTREDKVDFAKEILPILRRNCLACHNSTDAESDLVLESPEQIRKGGAEGPSAVPGKGAESLLVLLASRQRESFMPPDDNDVGAKRLTSEELGLLQLWIDQGAEGAAGAASTIQWQPLPEGLHPILTAAITGDSRYAAASRANQVTLYHIASKKELGRLNDPAAVQAGGYQHDGVAHLDLVQSLAFSPDGEWLASGGFRVAKLWKKTGLAPLHATPSVLPATTRMAASADGKQMALADGSGAVAWMQRRPDGGWDLKKQWTAHERTVEGLAFTSDGGQLLTVSRDHKLKWWDGSADEPIHIIETPSELLSVAVLDQSVAVGGVDKLIRLAPLSPTTTGATETDQAAQETTPLRELSGHATEVAFLAAVDGGTLLSGGSDGNLRRWNVAEAKELGQWNHGSALTAMTVDAASGKAATAGVDKKIRVWSIADAKKLAELEGDYELLYAQQEAIRQAALGKRRVDLAAADLKAGEDRKKAEEENQKKADEAAKKANEDLVAKTEAAKKPQADKAAADAAVAETEKQIPAVEMQLKAATEALPVLETAMKTAQQNVEQAKAAAEKIGQAADAAAKAKDEATKALEADPENKALMEAQQAATQAAESATKAVEDIKQKLAAAEKDLQEKDAALQKGAADKAALEKQLPELTAKLKQQQEEAKKLADPAKKATEAMEAAQRQVEGAERTATRAAEAVQRAAAEIPTLETARDQETQKHQELVAAEETAKQEYAASLQEAHSLQFLDSGRLIAAVIAGRVQTWCTDNSAVWETYGDEHPVQSVVGLPNAEFVTLAADNQLREYRSEISWRLARVLGSWDDPTQLADRVTALAFHPTQPLLAVGGGEPSRSGQINLWNIETGEKLLEIVEPHSDTVFNLSFSRDGEQLASCGADRFVKVFQTTDGKLVRSFEGHTHHVLDVDFNADGRELSSSGADKVVKVWNALTGDQVRTISGFGKEVTSLAYVGDQNQVLVGVGDKSVHIKRTDNGGNVRSFGGATDYVYAVSVSQDGKTLLAGGQDGVLRVWDDQGKVLAEFQPQ